MKHQATIICFLIRQR